MLKNRFLISGYNAAAIIFPKACKSCSKLGVVKDFCRDCSSAIIGTQEHSLEHCLVCNELALPGLVYCNACLIFPESYRRHRSIWLYEGVAAQLVRKIKYNDKTEIIAALSPYIFEVLSDQALWQLEDTTWPPWDLVVGLPSSRLRDIRRGFRQTALLARIAAKLLNIPYSINSLKRTGLQLPQVSLAIAQRRSNLINCFSANPHKTKDKKVLLIDDVTTSGASISEAASELIRAGAKSVDVLTLCRSSVLLKNRLTTRNATHLSIASSVCY